MQALGMAHIIIMTCLCVWGGGGEVWAWWVGGCVPFSGAVGQPYTQYNNSSPHTQSGKYYSTP